MRRGFSLVELIVTMGLMGFVFFSAMALTIDGLRITGKQDAEVVHTQQAAQALRKLSETIRDASTVSISNYGKTITYQLPLLTNSNDAATGEKEMIYPVQSDGVNKAFTVVDGKLKVGSQVLVSNVLSQDPDPNSSQYNQDYAPFSLTTIGSKKAVTINLIVGRMISGKMTYARMKTTIVVRNSQ